MILFISKILQRQFEAYQRESPKECSKYSVAARQEDVELQTITTRTCAMYSARVSSRVHHCQECATAHTISNR